MLAVQHVIISLWGEDRGAIRLFLRRGRRVRPWFTRPGRLSRDEERNKRRREAEVPFIYFSATSAGHVDGRLRRGGPGARDAGADGDQHVRQW